VQYSPRRDRFDGEAAFKIRVDGNVDRAADRAQMLDGLIE
jgi:hypothetical protein